MDSSSGVDLNTSPRNLGLITVRTKDELAWALANADEFIVKGEPEFLAYAKGLVEGPAPPGIVLDNFPSTKGIPYQPFVLDGIRTHDAAMRRRSRGQAPALRPVIGIVLLVIAVAVITLVFLQRQPNAQPINPNILIGAVVLIVAAILIHDLLKKGQHNIKVRWKVTEEGHSGDMTITKVQDPGQRPPSRARGARRSP